MMNEVLKYVPLEWEKHNDYSNNRYHMYDINQYNFEYNKVASKFQYQPIEKIQRLQNPFMYGRFLLRQEHLRARGEAVYTHTMYHPIGKQDAKNVAEYNCDYRRYTAKLSNQSMNKRAIFSSSPLDIQVSANMAIVVATVIHNSSVVPSSVVKDWDTEYYPNYIVNLSY